MYSREAEKQYNKTLLLNWTGYNYHTQQSHATTNDRLSCSLLKSRCTRNRKKNISQGQASNTVHSTQADKMHNYL